MLKRIAAIPALAALAVLATASTAFAHEHGAYANSSYYALAGDDQQYGNDDVQDDEDVAAVAQPVPSYNGMNDTIVTPYGYQPYYQNGYYQGYGYDQRYAYNPYYAAAQYSPVDPVAASVVGVISQAAQGGRVSGQELIQALVGGLVASQYQNQPQYGYDNNGYPPQYYQQPQYYSQPQYQPPVYVQQYVPQYVRQYVQPRYVRVYGERSHPQGDEHGDGEHGDNGDNGDHGD